MIVSDSLKSETSAPSRTSFGPVDSLPSPPPYTPTIVSSSDYRQVQSPQPARFRSASSVPPNLSPRCNYFIDRKAFSGKPDELAKPERPS
ncbi:hypothetical protein B0J17DRAFT_438476 [Rhizoctonia solani]|nr:hypothetical protein B0J17DRAFT_438476 [Rhizoctonia solani]